MDETSGTRVSTLHDDGGQTLTRYYPSTSLRTGFGGAYEETGGAVRKYYSIAGGTVVMRDSGGLKYFLTDHLGSVVSVRDASGSLLSEQRYLPFGEVRTDVGTITQTDFGYTFQRELEAGNGLMDYRARFYSASLNSFRQPDIIVPIPSNPQSWNRYSYVVNNPIMHIDPTGHCIKSSGDVDFSGYPYGTSGLCPEYQEILESGGRGKHNPNEDLRTSQKGIDFILDYENFVPCLYNDSEPWRCATGNVNDSPEMGNCTVGYGHLVHFGPCEGIGNPKEDPFTVGLSQSEGFDLFLIDLKGAESLVVDYVNVPLEQHQFDALVSFAFNIDAPGGTTFGNSDLVKRLNQGEYDAVPSELLRWVNPEWAREGLIIRRTAEGLMFSKGIYP